MKREDEYFAFISYKREDEKWAKWLQYKLEHYHLPLNLRKAKTDLPKEIRPIFKDTSELAAGVLADEIHKALEQSKYLIVICSPNAAQSEWVCKEVQAFIDMGKSEYIIPFIIGGTAYAQNPTEECFPSSLRKLPKEKELLGINISEMGREAAAVKVVARMFRLKFDTLWQRHEKEMRKRRIVTIAICLLIALTALFVGGYIYKKNLALEEANRNIIEERNNMLIARSRAISEKAADFVRQGNILKAIAVLLYIIPHDTDSQNLPYAPEAEAIFRKAIYCLERNQTETIGILENHQSPVLHAAYNHSGNILATASEDNSIILWDAHTGNSLKQLWGHKDKVTSAKFTKDDNFIVSSSWDKTIKIWDVKTGRMVHSINTEQGGEGLDISPDDKYLLVIPQFSNEISIWDMTTKKKIKVLKDDCGEISVAAFHPDSKRVVTVHTSLKHNSSINIWDLQTASIVRRITDESKEEIRAITFNSNGDKMATGSFDNSIAIWNINDGTQLLRLYDAHTKYITTICFSPDGTKILSGSWDKSAKIWDSETGDELDELTGHTDYISSVAFSPDGKEVVTASWDHTARIWKLIQADTNIQEIRVHEQDDGIVKALAYSHDGTMLATNQDYKINIYNTTDGTLLKSFTGHKNDVTSVAFSKDDTCLISASEDNTICFRDIHTGEVIRTLKHDWYVTAVDVSYDGKLLVSASYDGTAVIWDMKTGEALHVLKGEHGYLRAAKFSPDGKYVGTAADGNSVKLWDVKTGKELHTLKNSNEFVSSFFLSIAFSPDSKYVASSTNTNTILLWDVETGQMLHSYSGHQECVNCVVFSADGKSLVSGSYDNTIKIWDVESTNEIISFDTSSAVESVTFDPSGSFFAYGLWNGKIEFCDFFNDLKLKTKSLLKKEYNWSLPEKERREYYIE